MTGNEKAAKAAGLRYVSDATPGIARKPWRGGFRYLHGHDRPHVVGQAAAPLEQIVEVVRQAARG